MAKSTISKQVSNVKNNRSLKNYFYFPAAPRSKKKWKVKDIQKDRKIFRYLSNLGFKKKIQKNN